MKKHKSTLTLIGFILVVTGFMALVLSLVGLKISFLAWIDWPGPLFGFVLRLVFILAGFTLVYIAQTDFEGEDS